MRARVVEVVGVRMLVDRTGGKVCFGVPLFACIPMDVYKRQPEECPLCEKGVELKVT